MKIKNIFTLPIILLLFSNSFGQKSTSDKEKSWYTPDYVKTQFGGNIGLFSVGAGYELFNKVVNTEVLYGFVPKSITEADDVHLITVKNTFPVFFEREIDKDLTIAPILGFAAIIDIGPDTFTSLPSKYPDGYYIPNSIHFSLFAGASIHKNFPKSKFIKGLDFYVETGTIETYLWYAITTKEVNVFDVFSTDIGVNFYL